MRIKVSRSVHIPVSALQEITIPFHGYRGVCVVECNTAYGSRTGSGLVQIYSGIVASDTWGKYFQRRSEDNGRTWLEPEVVFEPYKTEAGLIRWNEGCLFLDETADRLLHFNNVSLFPEGVLSADVFRYTRTFVRISSDGGRHFSAPINIIQKGYDETNWAEGITYGKNRMYVSFPAPLKIKDGRILLPMSITPEKGKHQDMWLIPEKAGCLFGTWKGNDLEWEAGGFVEISPKISSRGLCEPTFAELPDGRLLMVMRGSNSGIEQQQPGYRWHSISTNGGYNWSEPSPWTYDNGEKFLSPASGSRLIRNSGNGRLYWFGNICRENSQGNLPRQPVQVAEVDEQKAALKKDSVAIIDDRGPDDPPDVQLSNFRVYEDRLTHEFLLNLARIGEISAEDITSPSYQYRIRIPDD